MRILQWVAISFSRGSFWPRDQTHTSCIGRRILYRWATGKPCKRLCFCSVHKLCLTLWHSVDCSMPGSHVLHYLPEFAQIHIHWVGDAILLLHSLTPPPPPFAFSLTPNQGIFQWVSFCIRWPKYWSFQSFHISVLNIQGWFTLGLTSLILLLSKGLSRDFSNTTIQKHQFFGA